VQLPGAERAFIDPAKLRDYLLSPEHPVGRTKARFFAALGFIRSAWPVLRTVLLDLALRGEAVIGPTNAHGQKYEVCGTIQGPSGREAQIVSIWIILNGEDFPRFVTAYPEGTP
jgi:hypothetical protein